MEAVVKKVLGFIACVLLAAAGWATPSHTPSLDGKPLEYDAGDLRGTFAGAPAWGADGTLTNLFVTWDDTYLYVALQGWHQNSKKLVVLLDADPGAGTGATTTTNWTGNEQSYLGWNGYGWVDGGSFGLDVMLASEGFYNNAIRVLYDGVEAPATNNTESLFDSGNGGVPAGTPVDMASDNSANACPHKGFETRIPWTVLYEGTRWGNVEPGETVPRGASLRLLAGLHTNDNTATWSSPDTIPNQAVEDYTNGILTTATYLDIPLDTDTNGIPDMLAGDVNAPWIRAAASAVGATNIYVAFNEPVTPASVENTLYWTVDGNPPVAAAAQGTNGVLLGLAAPIASTDLLPVAADGVADPSANTRPVEFCLFPAESGIPQAVTVTFLVNTNSGMGTSPSNARPTAFFVNGSTLPLEWGTPAVESIPLAPVPGSNGWTSATVVFPPGTPSAIHHKYSGRINGTNTYEAIRLADFGEAKRPLNLNTNGTPMTVVDYLGAAAYPLRVPGDTNPPSALFRLYSDPRRGDAGVRVRREILFQLDLSMRSTNNLARVMVMGSDPLRGFNDIGNNSLIARDYPDNSEYVDWTNAGIQLFDDGTHGDAAGGDGIYSRLWAFSTNGLDAVMEPLTPYSLVGGAAPVFFPDYIPGTPPYYGSDWISRRSPRSFIYKFFVLTTGGSDYDSPEYDLSYYVADPDETARIVIEPWVWDNEDIPPPPPSNAPALTGVSLTGATAYVQFENVLTEGGHGVRIAADLRDNRFDDYGHRAVPGATNGGVRQWSAAIQQATAGKEFYAAYAGLEPNPTPTYWEPNANIPTGATTVRVYFCQFQSNLSGKRNMNLTGDFAGWGNGLPMTFIGEGTWMIDLPLAAGNGVKFKPRGGPTLDWYETGGDFQFIRGAGGVTMDPMPPVPGETFTITLDAAGTPMAAVSPIYLHMGFDGWKDVQKPRPAMTNTSDTFWEYSFSVPTNYSVSIDWVFTSKPEQDDGTWYSDFNWHAFMAPYYNAP